MRSVETQQLLRWLEWVLSGKSARTRESYRYVLGRFCNATPADSLTDIRPAHFRSYYAKLRGEGISQNTITNFDRTLRAVFARIEREGREDFDLPSTWSNPLSGIEKERAQRKVKTPLSDVQARQLLRAAPRAGFVGYRNYAEIAFMLMTGARSVEVLNAKITDVDLDRSMVILRTTKGNKPRIVYLPSTLVRILSNYVRRLDRQLANQSEFLFPNRKGDVQTRRALHRAVQKLGRRIGLNDLGPHRLRHTYVTLSHAKGAPLKFLQEQCGHSSILVTQGYISLSETQKGQLAEEYSCL